MLLQKLVFKGTKLPKTWTNTKIIRNLIKLSEDFLFFMIFILGFAYVKYCLILGNEEKCIYTKKGRLNRIVSFQFSNYIQVSARMNCKNESIDQGRSYVGQNISISDCFFSRISQYFWNGGTGGGNLCFIIWEFKFNEYFLLNVL